MASKAWHEAQARKVLSALHSSGLSVEQFAKQLGVNSKRIYHWRRRLEGRRKPIRPNNSAKLLPIQIMPTSSLLNNEPITVLLSSGQQVQVGANFNEQAFKRAIAILEGM